MDAPSQPPVMPDQLPVAPHNKSPIFVVGVILLVALGVVAGVLWSMNRKTIQLSSGFSDRTVSAVAKLNQSVPVDGSCISEYQLLTGGRSADGQQHYVLSVELTSDPATQADLVARLASETCTKELTAIKQVVAPSINADTTPNILTMSFVSSPGTRLQLP